MNTIPIVHSPAAVGEYMTTTLEMLLDINICVRQVYSVHCLKPTKSQCLQLRRCVRHSVVSVCS